MKVNKRKRGDSRAERKRNKSIHRHCAGVPEGTELILRNSGTGEPTTRAGLFKIRHLGAGEYSIRSMLDSSMGWMHEGHQTSSATVGYTDADIDDNEKWVITSDELEYEPWLR